MYGFDESRRPLYFVRFSGKLVREDLQAMERDVMRLFERREVHACVWDLTQLEFPSREVISAGLEVSRRTAATFVEIYQKPPDAPAHYTAYVMSPRIARLVEFFHRIPARNIAVPEVFSDVDQGMRAAERELARLGVTVPARARTSATA